LHQLIGSLRRYAPNAALHVATVEHIDPQRQRIVTYHALNGRRHEIEYDHLLIAPQQVTDHAAYPGFAEHGYSIATYEECIALHNRLLTMMELADGCTDEAEKQTFLRFVVVGATVRGIQLATHLAAFQRELIKREYDGLRPEDCEVVLIDSHPCPLAEEGQIAADYPALANHVEQVLIDAGVRYLPATQVKAITPADVVLNDGQRLATQTVIDVIHRRAPDYLQPIMNQADRFSNISLLGDGATGANFSVRRRQRQRARQVAAQQIVDASTQATPESSEMTSFWAMLGPGYTVQERQGKLSSGYMIRLRSQIALFQHIPSWDRRARVVVDWFIREMIGRDIVATTIQSPSGYSIQTIHAEDGTVIYRAGLFDPHRYIILTGEVSVSAGDRSVATLYPGQDFTAEDIQEGTVRARGTTTLIKIPCSEFEEVATIISSLGSLGV
jgi:NADH dehydrogenase FAD-containing subunit